MPTRRSLLAAPAAMLLGDTSTVPLPPVPPPPGAGLHARAARHGMFFGTAVDDAQLARDPALMARIAADCGVVVGESSFKWEACQPAQGRFDFSRAEALMSYAARNQKRVRGHTLVWHEANPPWLEKALTPGTGEALMTSYIAAVAGHFRTRLAQWDVVNEPLHPEDGKPLGLRDTPWLRALGPAYLDIAFHAAAEADPGCLRVLNEFGLDYAVAWQERRRAALLELLSTLIARGVPVQAVGLQAHLNAAETAIDQGVLSRFVADIASLGLRVIVTELDVRDDQLPADIPTRDEAVANHAAAWLEPVVGNPAVIGLLSWGLSDRRSWLNKNFPRKDGLPQRPLPLDTELNRKRLWTALAGVLDAAPPRTGG